MIVGCSCFLLLGCSQEENYSASPAISMATSVTTKQVTEMKVERQIIVIDPGHSSVGNKEKEPIAPRSKMLKAKDVLGASGIRTKTPEYEITLSVGLLVKDELEKQGFDVIMTKSKRQESLSNIERAEIGNKANAALVIRLHCDGAENKSVHGASMLIPKENEFTKGYADVSKVYGQTILDTYCQQLGLKNRGLIYREDLTGFNWSTVPTVLIEMGFLSNVNEDQFLSNENNHSKIAKAIAEGISTSLVATTQTKRS